MSLIPDLVFYTAARLIVQNHTGSISPADFKRYQLKTGYSESTLNIFQKRTAPLFEARFLKN
ncbi:MAG TPA: hypothetical protein DCQ96_03865 [Verrucomicrobiales bacterium]|nr:hypothetical protein [Euryarchaeota archaeon]HAO95171.1 hypothetical protein [Verrucomicrobiales bacterium]